MSEHYIKQTIAQTLSGFAEGALAESAFSLFEALGYRSDKRLDLSPNTPENFATEFDEADQLNPQKALLGEWESVDLLFQLTDDEVRAAWQGQLPFDSTQKVDDSIMHSYLSFAVGLQGERYTRTQLASITREINKLFPMPVMVLFRHGRALTLSIIHRREHKRDPSKDVLEKVTLIKDINFANPHRAHIEILHDLSLAQLYDKYAFSNFVELHRAWQRTLDTSELNKRFFREVANWYFWAIQHVTFPKDAGEDEETRNASSVIRMITRLIFIWFIKEKGLVPPELFVKRKVDELLNYADPNQSTYYKAILQNLFFATLNQEMNTPEKPGNRKFRHRRAGGRDQHFMVHNVYRYEAYFRNPDEALQLFASIPFLNGGLFECLDRPDKNNPKKTLRVDGFSDRPDNALVVPDFLFFSGEQEIDLNQAYGTRNKRYKVRGLLDILDSYKFTVEENTPIEEEIALDPELLGKVFENLLAAYNPETGVTARKQTGSFYTPREIVNYMVDESLAAYFESRLEDLTGLRDLSGLDERLRHLLAYNDEPHRFSQAEVTRLVEAIDTVKILDPACGSGAFPMGVLHKLVYILSKLDLGNERWKEKQILKASEIPDSVIREKVIADIEQAFERNELDYGRKLYLIENCIYGVDIQPIAVQIAKLRCFISLVVDQRIDDAQPNRGVRPLPNLETRFVAANTLLDVDKPAQLALRNPAIDEKERELAEVRRNHFTARTPRTKDKYRQLDAQLRAEISDLLKKDGFPSETTKKLAYWDPYDQNASATFFDPEWMFGISGGFDVAIGNPPYVRIQTLKQSAPRQVRDFKQRYTAAQKGNYDLYVVFVERGLNLLSERGRLAYILPHKFFNAKYGQPLRGLLSRGRHLAHIVHFGDQQAFPGSTTYVCLLFLDKAGSDECCFARVDDLAEWYDSGEATEGMIPASSITAAEWNFVVGEGAALFERLSEMPVKLGHIAHIFVGLQTSADTVFLFKEYEKTKAKTTRAYSKELDQYIDLESALLKPVVRSGDIGRFWAKPMALVLFPYQLVNGEFQLIPENRMKRDFPKAWDYLVTNKRLLSEREHGKFKGTGWYQLYPKNLDVWEQPKIMLPYMITHLSAYYDDNDLYFVNVTTGGFGITLDEQYSTLKYMTGSCTNTS